MEIVVKNTI